MQTLQEMILSLLSFWKDKNCIIHQGYDLEVGAGTFNPATFLRALGKEPYKAAYIEPSRRPQDGRYGTHPNRLQNYHQLQVILKPCPKDIQHLYLQSLKTIGLNLKEHDIRFVHDDWENPTIGAWGLGWEVWLNGMEMTQLTYFQAIGSQPLEVISGEITYGIERIAMYLQEKNSIFDIMWNESLTYGDIVYEAEKEWSHYNFEEANTKMWFNHFEDFYNEAKCLINKKLPIPAYDFVIKSSHAFNILDARGLISVTERTRYITSIRNLAKMVAEAYIEKRKHLNYPLLSYSEEKQISPPISSKKFTIKKDKADLLIEIGVEELPDSFISIGSNSFQDLLINLFKENDLSYKSLKMLSTPRRLTCLVENLDMITPHKVEIKKGPSLLFLFLENGLISEQGKNFFKKLNITIEKKDDLKNFSFLSIKKVNNIQYLFIEKNLGGKSTFKILQDNLIKILSNIYFPKKMYWDSSYFSFARPIRWLVVMLDDQVLPLSIANVFANNISYGHRQLDNNSEIIISSAKNYISILKKHFVLVDPKEREQKILNEINSLEEKNNFSVICKKQLVPIIVNLTEFPQVALGSFKQEFCNLPKELLIAEMVDHQKYFPIVDLRNKILNSFIIVSDNKLNNNIIKGNERALEPRLTDGSFLFKEDLKIPHDTYLEKLKSFIFFDKLGSMFDKTERLKLHLKKIHSKIPLCPQNDIEQAISLSKLDLVSNVVKEFPELQGIMGYYYADHLKLYSSNTTVAIKEQYTLISKNTEISPTGILLSFIDKIDNLLSCFLLNLKPTSSHDPYALRRQSIEILWLILQNKLSFNFYKVLEECLNNFPREFQQNNKKICREISEFIINRFKIILIDLNYSKDIITAVLTTTLNNIPSMIQKAEKLSKEASDLEKEIDQSNNQISIKKTLKIKDYANSNKSDEISNNETPHIDFYQIESKLKTLSRLIAQKNQQLINLIKINHRIRKLLLSHADYLYVSKDFYKSKLKIYKPKHLLVIDNDILNRIEEIELHLDNNQTYREDPLKHIYMLSSLCPLLENLFEDVKIISEDETEDFRLLYLNRILILLDDFCLFDNIKIPD